MSKYHTSSQGADKKKPNTSGYTEQLAIVRKIHIVSLSVQVACVQVLQQNANLLDSKLLNYRRWGDFNKVKKERDDYCYDILCHFKIGLSGYTVMADFRNILKEMFPNVKVHKCVVLDPNEIKNHPEYKKNSLKQKYSLPQQKPAPELPVKRSAEPEPSSSDTDVPPVTIPEEDLAEFRRRIENCGKCRAYFMHGRTIRKPHAEVCIHYKKHSVKKSKIEENEEHPELLKLSKDFGLKGY